MAGYIGKSQGVTLLNVESNTVETADIQDGAVTAAKLDQTYLTPTGDGSQLTGIEALPDAIDVNASAPADSLNIDSSGDVGIGTSSPQRILHTSGDHVRFDNNGGMAILLLDTLNNEGFRVVTNRDGTGAFSIEDMGTATSGAGSERMRILSTGGITFNGDTSTANALDDYEEGTYTLTVTPETSGSVTLISNYQKMFYTKIGRVVHIQGTVNIQSTSSPSGTLRFSLPFAVNSGDQGAAYSGNGNVRFYNMNFNTSYIYTPMAVENQSYFYLMVSKSGQTSSIYNGGDLTGNGNEYITFGLTYFTN